MISSAAARRARAPVFLSSAFLAMANKPSSVNSSSAPSHFEELFVLPYQGVFGLVHNFYEGRFV